MNEIANAVNAALDNLLTSAAIEKMIAAKLEVTIRECIDNALRGYSDFGKNLQASINQGLQVDLSRLQLVGYHDFILKYIQRQLDASLCEQAAIQIDTHLKDLLKPPPKQVLLTELVAEFIESQSDWKSVESESITLIIEKTDHGYIHIYMDAAGNKDKYRCRYQIDIDSTNAVYSLKIDDSDPKRKLFVGPLYRVERTLFNLYASKTKLIIDQEVDAIDLNYPERHCEC